MPDKNDPAEGSQKPIDSNLNAEGVKTTEVGDGEAKVGNLDALELAKKEAEAAQRELLYVRADFDNYRKRILRDQDQAVKQANKNLILEIVGVLDLLERAIASAGPLKSLGNGQVDNFISGIEMTRQEFAQTLSRFGVTFVGAVGEKFDPEKHEAVGQQEVSDEKVDSVTEVHQRGCTLHGKLIIPAKVSVGIKAQG